MNGWCPGSVTVSRILYLLIKYTTAGAMAGYVCYPQFSTPCMQSCGCTLDINGQRKLMKLILICIT